MLIWTLVFEPEFHPLSSYNYQVVLCTCPDQAVGETLARGLVEGGLAACVNVVGGLRSIYRWKGQVEVGDEVLLLIKCVSARFGEIETFIKTHHPYELPEVVAVPLVAGSEAYLSWLANPDK